MNIDKQLENLLKHYKDMLELKKREIKDLNSEENKILPINKSLEEARILGQMQYIKFFVEDLEKISINNN